MTYSGSAPARTETEACGNCHYQGPAPKMDPGSSDRFLCRRFPPNSQATDTIVDVTGWCGEWQAHRGYAVPS